MHAYGGHSGKLISSTTDAVIVWNVKPMQPPTLHAFINNKCARRDFWHTLYTYVADELSIVLGRKTTRANEMCK